MQTNEGMAEHGDPELGKYRVKAVVALLLVYLPLIAVDQLRAPDLLFEILLIPAIGVLIYLTVVTANRLSAIGYSSGWVLLMIMQLNFGPVIYEARHGNTHLTVTVGGLLGMLPVLLCFFLPTRAKQAT